jgi:hypothetical protein
MTLYSPDSNVIFLVFKLIMAWLSNSQSSPSNVGYGVVPSTISITSKSALVRTPSKLDEYNRGTLSQMCMVLCLSE